MCLSLELWGSNSTFRMFARPLWRASLPPVHPNYTSKFTLLHKVYGGCSSILLSTFGCMKTGAVETLLPPKPSNFLANNLRKTTQTSLQCHWLQEVIEIQSCLGSMYLSWNLWKVTSNFQNVWRAVMACDPSTCTSQSKAQLPTAASISRTFLSRP